MILTDNELYSINFMFPEKKKYKDNMVIMSNTYILCEDSDIEEIYNTFIKMYRRHKDLFTGYQFIIEDEYIVKTNVLVDIKNYQSLVIIEEGDIKENIKFIAKLENKIASYIKRLTNNDNVICKMSVVKCEISGDFDKEYWEYVKKATELKFNRRIISDWISANDNENHTYVMKIKEPLKK